MFRLTLIVCAMLAAGAAQADPADLRRAGRIDGDAAAGAAKVAVCVACHGPEGNAIVPAFPALAGQSAEYLYRTLAGFKRRADPASPMTAQVATLDDTDLRNVAAYFASRKRVVATPAPEHAAGAALFDRGDAARGIVPCRGCHGATAHGHPLAAEGAARYAWYPALAGQNADYVVARLGQYRDGKIDDTSNAMIMRGVAQNLDDASIRALADWLAAQR